MDVPNHTDTWYIFKGIDEGARGLKQNAEYKFIVSATATINGQSQTIESHELTTTTLPALVFGAPKVRRIDGVALGTPKLFKGFRWKISNSAQVRLGNTTWGRETNPGRYQYAFEVPEETGLQIGTAAIGAHAECNWGSWPSETSSWTLWQFPIQLVRCEIGDGTDSVTVKVRNKDHAYEWEAASIRIEKSWHDANHRVDYQVDCMPAPTADLDYNVGITRGASGWNTAGAGVRFGKLVQNKCALKDEKGRVTVKRYTSGNPCGSQNPNIILACVSPAPSVHPHLATQTLYINGNKPWASDADGDRDIADHEKYLPAAMIHEFGHAAGLGHSGNSNDLMHFDLSSGAVINAPRANDVSAMKSIYQNHTSH